MYSMKAFILQGLPPTHTNWTRRKEGFYFILCLNVGTELFFVVCFSAVKVMRALP